MTELSGSRLETPQLLLPLQPAEMRSVSACRRCEASRMRLATCLAVTVADWTELIHFVSYGSAEATSFHCSHLDTAHTFDAAFSSADPVGAGEPATGFYVTATQGGERVAVGTAVRALIDGTVCAESTIRNFGGDDVGAIVTVAGPQVDGCVQGGRIVFEVGGQAAAPTATNDLMGSDKHNNLELTVP